MRKDVVNEEASGRNAEALEPDKIKVSVFDFKKDWALVEPHLNDPEVLELFNEGMLEFSTYHRWKHLPLWDPNNDIGPWRYALGDSHDSYATDKVNDDPEAQALGEKYERICSDERIEFEEVFYENNDPKKGQIFKAYGEEWNEIQRKYLPEKNTYRWYQCFFAGLYLKDWQLALAKKVFPDYAWRVYEEHDTESKSCTIAHIGKGPNQNFLIFNIFLFETDSADEMLESVGLDRNSLEEEPIDRLIRRILN